MNLQHIDWSWDQDWDEICLSPAHRFHHLRLDSYGTYICRECSTDRLYVLRDDEVKRLLLADKGPQGR